MDWHDVHPEVWAFEISFDKARDHLAHPDSGSRKWTKDRYVAMADFRNQLLDKARVLEPDKYFSLDTDILLENPKTIEHLDGLTDSVADAAAPLMFMTPRNIMAPSTMTWGNNSLRAYRGDYKYGTDFKTDVIMAAKMMNPEVYKKVNYAYHPQGEDLGWSWNCKEQGFNLYCASSIYAPHIMSQSMLDDYHEKGDLRAIILHKKLQNSV